MTILYRRAVVLAKIETSFGVDASPSPVDDAMLIEDPQFSAEAATIERSNVSFDISPAGIRVGRKTARLTFLHEVRGQGTAAIAPVLGRLIRACGFAETSYQGAATVDTPVVVSGSSSPAQGATWAKAGTSSRLSRGKYRHTVVLGGISGVAKIRTTGGNIDDDTDATKDQLTSETFSARVYRVDGGTATVSVAVNATDPLSPTYTITGFAVGDYVELTVLGFTFTHTVVSGDSDANGIATALRALIDTHPLIISGGATNVVDLTFTGAFDGVVVTSGTTGLVLGASGCTVTPTWSGSLVIGDAWTTVVHAEGFEYSPISTAFPSATVYVYYDGLLHKMTGCRGSFSLAGNGGELAKFTFSLVGNYIDPIDSPVPANTVFDSVIPPAVELAALAVANYKLMAAAGFTFDLAGQVNIRENINKANAFDGTLITARQPAATITPEATLASEHPFWQAFADARFMNFHVKVGTVKGNVFRIISDRAQYATMAYGNRTDIRILEVGIRFGRNVGNDEVLLAFS